MDIIIHDLISSTKNKIRCKRFIKKIAIYKNNLAALTPDRICLYDLDNEETSKVPKFYIQWEQEATLILLTKNHVVICLDNRIMLYPLNNSGLIEREWSFDYAIKYIKVIGGGPNKEALVSGLKSGEVYMIYLDNQFSVLLYSHEVSIRCLDVSANRKKLAIVDDNFNILVVDIGTKQIIWDDEKAKSVAFNTDIEDMICYSFEGNIYIKTATFPPTSEKMNGFIVGFKGTKIYILQASNTISVLDISQSVSIMRYIETKNFQEAYKVATLGATMHEWMYVGFESLMNFDLVVSINSFKKVGDIKLINLCYQVEDDLKKGSNKDLILGDLLAFQGRYTEAASAYIKGGNPEKAVDMFSTLKRWAEAIEIRNKYLSKDPSSMNNEILAKQAEWLFKTGKFKEAADLFKVLGQNKRAIEIYGENDMKEELIVLCRQLNKTDHADLIALCGTYFKKNNHYAYAKEAYLKLGDTKSLVQMNIELNKWDEAFLLAQSNKALLEYVNLKYAEYLLDEDRFEEAQQSFKKAGRIDLSIRYLEKLIDNAVYEKRHKDAFYYYYCLSQDILSTINNFQNPDKDDIKKVKDFKEIKVIQDLYNAYHLVYKYIEEPFSKDLSSIDSYGLFSACRFIVNTVSGFRTSRDIKSV